MGLFFHGKKQLINFAKKRIGQRFGRFFSQTQLVTLRAMGLMYIKISVPILKSENFR
jgi:hypothetical protein